MFCCTLILNMLLCGRWILVIRILACISLIFWPLRYMLTRFLVDHMHRFHGCYKNGYPAALFFGIFSSLS